MNVDEGNDPIVHQKFIDDICATNDDVIKGIYADWLEEHTLEQCFRCKGYGWYQFVYDRHGGRINKPCKDCKGSRYVDNGNVLRARAVRALMGAYWDVDKSNKSVHNDWYLFTKETSNVVAWMLRRRQVYEGYTIMNLQTPIIVSFDPKDVESRCIQWLIENPEWVDGKLTTVKPQHQERFVPYTPENVFWNEGDIP